MDAALSWNIQQFNPSFKAKKTFKIFQDLLSAVHGGSE